MNIFSISAAEKLSAFLGYGDYGSYSSTSGLGSFGIVSWIVGILAVIGYIVACIEIAQIAHDKGHEKVNGLVCFFFGLPYMVCVASLPDLKARGNLGADGGNSDSTNSNSIIIPDSVGNFYGKRYTWNCPNCGAVNPNHEYACIDCGTEKPEQ